MTAVAPTAGPSQCRVPPSAAIRITLSAIQPEKVSPTVTYETKTPWIPPARPARPQDSASAASL